MTTLTMPLRMIPPQTTLLSVLRTQLQFWSAEVDRLDTEIATAIADREGMYSPQEWDAKTRAIAAMMRQRQEPQSEMEYYARAIARVTAELGESK